MKEINLKAYGKINLGLDVIRKRPDGYHDLKMIMQTVSVCDDVLIRKNNEHKIRLGKEMSDLGRPEDNLAYRAAKLLLEEFHISDGVDISIEKKIPVAGGMAGGSSDCAAVLKGVNILFDLGLSRQDLMDRGVSMGADVPYCVIGGTAISEGIGDILTEITSPPDCSVLIARPPVYVSTAYVYSKIAPEKIKEHPDIDGIADAIKEGDLYGMCKKLKNVMEPVTAAKYPEILQIEEVMEKNGALKAVMSGSGPTVFGIFENRGTADNAYEMLRKTGLAKQLYIAGWV